MYSSGIGDTKLLAELPVLQNESTLVNYIRLTDSIHKAFQGILPRDGLCVLR